MIQGSGKVGVLFRDESDGKDFWPNRNTIENNRIVDSGPADGVAIDIQGKTRDVTIVKNEIREMRRPMNRTGIRIGKQRGSRHDGRQPDRRLLRRHCRPAEGVTTDRWFMVPFDKSARRYRCPSCASIDRMSSTLSEPVSRERLSMEAVEPPAEFFDLELTQPGTTNPPGVSTVTITARSTAARRCSSSAATTGIDSFRGC